MPAWFCIVSKTFVPRLSIVIIYGFVLCARHIFLIADPIQTPFSPTFMTIDNLGTKVFETYVKEDAASLLC